jgi:hypothetical protein
MKRNYEKCFEYHWSKTCLKMHSYQAVTDRCTGWVRNMSEDALLSGSDRSLYRVGQTQLGNFLSLITNQSNNTRENGKVPFVVDGWQL